MEIFHELHNVPDFFGGAALYREDLAFRNAEDNALVVVIADHHLERLTHHSVHDDGIAFADQIVVEVAFGEIV